MKLGLGWLARRGTGTSSFNNCLIQRWIAGEKWRKRKLFHQLVWYMRCVRRWWSLRSVVDPITWWPDLVWRKARTAFCDRLVTLEVSICCARNEMCCQNFCPELFYWHNELNNRIPRRNLTSQEREWVSRSLEKRECFDSHWLQVFVKFVTKLCSNIACHVQIT